MEKLKVAGRAWRLETEALAPVMEEIDLVINATSVGLEEAQASPLAGELFSPRHYLYDAVYRPARTALIEAAAARGARTSNGLGMLLHQGARAFELWTEAKAPLTVMRRALRSAVYGESS